MTHSLGSKVLRELLSLTPTPRTILEIGTGEGTRALAENFNVISIEHDPQYHAGVSELIHVPLRSCRDLPLPKAFWKRFEEASEWYDFNLLAAALEGRQYDAIIVDGPHGGARRAAMWWFYGLLFDTSVPVIVDDVHRRYDWLVAANIARIKEVSDFKVVLNDDKEGMFAVING